MEELHAKREIAIDGILEKMPRKTLSIMGPLNKTWFSFKEAMVHENSMRQIDLVEMIQCLEESVMLVLSVIFDNRGLNVLPAAQKKKRQKHKRSGKTTRKAKCCFI